MWYAKWKYGNGYLCTVAFGHTVGGYVGNEPQYFKTKKQLREIIRGNWLRGTWIICKK